MKFASSAVLVLLLATSTAYAEGNYNFGTAWFDAITKMCSAGDSAKADEMETRLLRNMGCDDDVTGSKEALAYHRNRTDRAARDAYDAEFAEHMRQIGLFSSEDTAAMCREILSSQTPCAKQHTETESHGNPQDGESCNDAGMR